MNDDAAKLIDMAVAHKAKALTDDERARREAIRERAQRLQERGITRGPNAHPDGTFGKLKK